MTVLLISLCNVPPPPADCVDCGVVIILVGSVVETISIAPAAGDNDDDAPAFDADDAAAALADAEAFVVVDDVSAGVWVVVNAAVTLAAVVTIFEHIVDPSMDGVQNVFSLSALGEETSTWVFFGEKFKRKNLN